MGKWILGAALIAWGFIIGLAHKLADLRADACHFRSECRIPALAERDAILIAGLIVALLGLIALAMLVTRSARAPAHPSTIRAAPSRLR